MQTETPSPPRPDELEVSLFGPQYGEAVALHVGAGNWILVDSCINPASGRPASIEYLRELGFDPSQAVMLIVASHWHDDHIRGLASLIQECRAARFAISGALRHQEFLMLSQLYASGGLSDNSGLDEFGRILRLLEARRIRGVRFNPPQFAVADRLLLQHSVDVGNLRHRVEVYSLSPPDAALFQANIAFSQLLPSPNEPKRRVAPPTPNYTSVVLHIRMGRRRVLLGADLENTSALNTGWRAILDDSTLGLPRAQVFKVPHHGSSNAHEDRAWEELLDTDPFALVTPFVLGDQVLPSPRDVERLSRFTSNVFLTAPAAPRRTKWRDPVVRDVLAQAALSIEPVNSAWGQVRLRTKIEDQGSAWEVRLFGDAIEI